MTECQFADDAALLATTKAGAEVTMRKFLRTAKHFGLNVSFTKTKMIVTGRKVTDTKNKSLQVGNEKMKCVLEFPYFGSLIASSGRVDVDIE